MDDIDGYERGESTMSEEIYMMHEGRYVQYDLVTGKTKLVDCLEPLSLGDQTWYMIKAAGWKNLYDVNNKHIGFVRTVSVDGDDVAQAVLVQTR
jgi:hypothetical protein